MLIKLFFIFRSVFAKALKDGHGKLTVKNLIARYEVRGSKTKTKTTNNQADKVVRLTNQNLKRSRVTCGKCGRRSIKPMTTNAGKRATDRNRGKIGTR